MRAPLYVVFSQHHILREVVEDTMLLRKIAASERPSVMVGAVPEP
jgi:hypothetical protein